VFSGKEGFKVTVLEQNATPGDRAENLEAAGFTY
jgi:phytoene dehydrogenase-like protein